MFATANWQNAERMWEQKTERLWEQLNAPDADQGRYCESISDMEVVSKHLDKAIDFLAQAADDVHGLPLENKVIALLDALEDMACDIRALRGRVQDGSEK